MAYLVHRSDSDGANFSGDGHVPDNDVDLYRSAVDFADAERILLADPQSAGFSLVARDGSCGISIYSRAVADCPVHMMRAEVILPFTPAELLACVSPPLRQQWDTHITELRLIRVLPPPPPSPSQLQRAEKCGGMINVPAGQLLRPGERRVALQYMAVHSPIPFVQNRDFEMVVAEEVRPDGTAWVKAFSTPLGYAEPYDERQAKYVRALMLFSAIVAQPLEGGGCRMAYVAIVHPMGLLPAFVVNMVISAQLTTLRKLLNFKMPSIMETTTTTTATATAMAMAMATAGDENTKPTSIDKDMPVHCRKSKGVGLPRTVVVRDASVRGTPRKKQNSALSVVKGMIKKFRSHL